MRRRRKKRRREDSLLESYRGGSGIGGENNIKSRGSWWVQGTCTCRNKQHQQQRQQIKVKPQDASSNTPQVQPIEALIGSPNGQVVSGPHCNGLVTTGEKMAHKHQAITTNWRPPIKRQQTKICLLSRRCCRNNNEQECRLDRRWNKSARSAVVVVCLMSLIVILSGSSFQASLCDPQLLAPSNSRQQQQQTKPVKLSVAIGESKSTVIGTQTTTTTTSREAEVNEGSSRVSGHQKQQLQQRKLAQHEPGPQRIARKSAESEDFAPDLSLGASSHRARLVVRGDDEAQLGCHLLGKPIEFSSSSGGWKSVAPATTKAVKLEANNETSGYHQDDSSYGATSGSGSFSGFSVSSSGSSDADSPPAPQIVLDGGGSGGDHNQDQSVDLNESDLVSLVFWYKDDNPTPIYTLDARQVAAVPYYQTHNNNWTNGTTRSQEPWHRPGHNREPIHSSSRALPLSIAGGIGSQDLLLIQNNRQLLAEAKHYPSPSLADGNARLELDIASQFPIIKLIIGRTGGQDSGAYKCRVDFRRSRTVSQFVDLLVEVPISRLEIAIGPPLPLPLLPPSSTLSQAPNKPSGQQAITGTGRNVAVGLGGKRVDTGGVNEPELLGAGNDEPSTRAHLPGLVVFSENQEAQFTCLALDASPAPTISWLIRWPKQQISPLATNRSNEQQQQLLIDNNRTLESHGARLEASLMTRDQLQDWLLVANPGKESTNTADQEGQAGPEKEVGAGTGTALVVGSRLMVGPMTRGLQGVRIGCRASQQLTMVSGPHHKAAKNRNHPTNGSGNPRQSPHHGGNNASHNPKVSGRPPTGNQNRFPHGTSSLNGRPGQRDGKQIFGPIRSDIRMIDVQTNVINISNANNNERQTLPFQQQQQQQQQQNQLQLTKWFELKLRLSPQKIEILSEQARPEVEGVSGSEKNVWLAELNEGQSGKFLCSSRGSQPGAKLRWSWSGERALPAAGGWQVSYSSSSSMSDGPPPQAFGGAQGDSSSSLLEITPVSWRHHLAQLVCTATNEELEPDRPDRSLRARIRLLVKFKPIVRVLDWPPSRNNEPPLTAAATAPISTKAKANQQDSTKSGVRHLKCSVQSNPPINQLVWLVNERPLARVTAELQQQPKPPAASARGMAAATSAPPRRPGIRRNRLPKSRVPKPLFVDGDTGSEIITASISSTYTTTTATATATATPTADEVGTDPDMDDLDGDDGDDDDDDGDFNLDESRMDGRPTTGASDTLDQVGGQQLMVNWSMTPLVPAATDGSKYSIDGNLLTITNLTKLDQQDEYKCLAINSLGQGTSEKFQLSVNYKPLCLTSQQHRNNPDRKKKKVAEEEEVETSSSRLDETLGLGLQADQIWQVDESSGSVQCQVEARPAPSRFAWSFVPLGELVRLAEARKRSKPLEGGDTFLGLDREEQVPLSLLNQSASLWLETEGKQLGYQELLIKLAGLGGHRNKQQQQQHGLLLCRALNSVGWQEKPCVNLVLTPELLEPSAENCSVEPLIERRSIGSDGNSSPELLVQEQQQHLAISVNCSRARNKDRLLFQLDISRRDEAHGRQPHQTATWPATWQNKRLLFTEPADSDSVVASSSQTEIIMMPTRRIPVSNLLAANLKETRQEDNTDSNAEDQQQQQQQPEVGVQKDQQPQNRLQATGGRIMTLSEQVGLLRELVFSISASNLMQTSEPLAILGSQLRLPEVIVGQPDNERRQQQQLDRPGNGQVSRSASHADSLTGDNEGQQQQQQLLQTPLSIPVGLVGQQASSSSSLSSLQQSPTGGARRAGGPPPMRQPATDAGTFSQHLEANIILIAIGGIAILSGLTLTLIILLLRGRPNGSQSDGDGTEMQGRPFKRFQNASRTSGEIKPQSVISGAGGGNCEFSRNSRPSTPMIQTKMVNNINISRLTTPTDTDTTTATTTTTSRVNFLAPPVSGLNGPMVCLSVQQPSMRGSHHGLSHTGSHLSLVRALSGPEDEHHQPETLYVIGGGGGEAVEGGGFEGGSFDQMEEAGCRGLDVSFTDEPCSSSAGHHHHHHHLFESGAIVDHLFANHIQHPQQQQLLGYCSPSICNSSSHHESLATLTNTTTTTPTKSSDPYHQQQLHLAPSDYKSPANFRLVDISSSSGSSKVRNNNNNNHNDLMENQQTKQGTTRTPVAPPSTSACGTETNSMYLFSFL